MDDNEVRDNSKSMIEVFKLAQQIGEETKKRQLALNDAIAGTLLEMARPSAVMVKFWITAGAMLVAGGRVINDVLAMTAAAVEGAGHSISGYKDAQGAMTHEQVVAMTVEWKSAFPESTSEHAPKREHAGSHPKNRRAPPTTKLEEVGFVRKHG